MTGRPVNPDLQAALGDYLARRRALGHALVEEERLARRFLEWLWGAGHTGAGFTAADAVRWARGEENTFARSYQGQRLGAVRGLARYCRAIGMDVDVPPGNALPTGRQRRRPHIYTQDEIDALMACCPHVFREPLVGATMTHIIGLLAVTGMRIGEALRLRVQDVDTNAGTVLIRANKHGPDRRVPLHPTTLAALADYRTSPDRRAAGPRPDGPLFVTVRGTGYQRNSVESHFGRVRDAAGLTWQGPTPSLHDLRHTFTTRAMIAAYTSHGTDPAVTLGLLATWLGHADPAHTYWYVEAVPELLALAASRALTTK